MTISVIMAVYNGERYLEEAVESILTQTFLDFEFLIVDDGSTDKSAKILAGAASRDARFRVITNQANIGLTRSLNKALAQACGTLIARMDADDVAPPERFERQIAFLQNNPEVGVVGTAYRFINEEGETIGERAILTDNESIQRALIRFNPFLHSSVMMRKVLLDNVGGYDKRYTKAQDYDLWMRLAPLCHFANLSEVLMKKRFTADMISYAQERKQIKAAVRIRLEALKRRQYPWRCAIFLIKPFFAAILPVVIVRFLRVHMFNQHTYARVKT